MTPLDLVDDLVRRAPVAQLLREYPDFRQPGKDVFLADAAVHRDTLSAVFQAYHPAVESFRVVVLEYDAGADVSYCEVDVG